MNVEDLIGLLLHLVQGVHPFEKWLKLLISFEGRTKFLARKCYIIYSTIYISFDFKDKSYDDASTMCKFFETPCTSKIEGKDGARE